MASIENLTIKVPEETVYLFAVQGALAAANRFHRRAQMAETRIIKLSRELARYKGGYAALKAENLNLKTKLVSEIVEDAQKKREAYLDTAKLDLMNSGKSPLPFGETDA